MIHTLKLLQYNCHNEPETVSSLLNVAARSEIDILCLQEPYTYHPSPVSHPGWVCFGKTGPTEPADFGTYPHEREHTKRPRVLTYVSKRLKIANINIVGAPHPDLISIQVILDDDNRDFDSLVVTNLYNPGQSSDSIPPLLHNINALQPAHHVLVGDFNAHHPLWQTNVKSISRHAEAWVTATQALHLDLVTPPDTATFHYGGARALASTIDLCFATGELMERVTACGVCDDLDTGSDHMPVLTAFDLRPVQAEAIHRHNMRKCDTSKLASATRAAWTAEQERLPDLDSAESVARWAEALQRAMKTGLEQSTPLVRPSPRSQAWYDETSDSLRSLTNGARRRWQKERTEVTRRFYVYMRNVYKSHTRTAKRQHRRAALATADSRSLWRQATAGRAAGGGGIVGALRSADGSIANSPAEKERVLRSAFWGGALGTAPTPETGEDQDLFSVISADAGGMEWADFTADEVHAALQRSAKHTAPGPDGVPWEALTKLSSLWSGLTELLARLFSACIRFGHHPQVWKEAVTVVLRKPSKPDYANPKAYRPMALLNTTAKLMEGMVAGRILRAAEHLELVPKEHYGGRPHRGADDALLSLQSFIQQALRAKRRVVLLTADVSGAYNSVIANILAHDLEERGWPPPVIAWCISFMRGRTSSLRFTDHISEPFAVPDALPQGSPISQLLWLVYSAGLVEAAKGEKFTLSIGWVDDWTAAVSAARVRDLEARLQRICGRASEWARKHGASFDSDKTGILAIQRPNKKSAGAAGRIKVTLGGNTVRNVPSCKILGLTCQEDRSFSQHVSETIRKATNAVGALLKWGNRAWGFSADNMRQLYNQGVAPLMEHACSVWLAPMGARGGQGYINRLQKVQRSAAIRITGAFRSTSTASLDFEAGLLPVHLRLYERQALNLLRLKTVPETHPLASTVDRACRTQPKRLPGPLHRLANAYPEVAKAKLNRKLAASPEPLPRMAVTIPTTKETAKAHHDATFASTFHDTLHAYTDGSGHDGRFGAAAHFVGGRAATRPADILLPLGRMSTVYRSESRALRAALEAIPTGTRAYAWTDSRALALAVRKPGAQDPDVRAIQDLLAEPQSNIEVAWLPGHKDIPGNEAADSAAKRAANRACAHEEQEPAFVKQWVRRKMALRWQKEWDGAKTGAAHRTSNRLRVRQAFKLYKGLSRPACSLLAQLRTNHIATNQYLKWRKLADSSLCERCHVCETREHLVLACARGKDARRALVQLVGAGDAQSLARLVNSGARARAVLKVIAPRFDCYRGGDVPDPVVGGREEVGSGALGAQGWTEERRTGQRSTREHRVTEGRQRQRRPTSQ